ncbi:MAG: CHAT domain-containing protein [Longimicrobiaceae bacterium]
MPELHLRLTGTDLSAVTPELEWQRERHTGNPLDLRLDPKDTEDVRWLWEDPMVDLFEPGKGRRRRAEEAAARIGTVLGRAFAASEEMRRLLDRALAPGQQPLVLISSSFDPVLALPWELARTPAGSDLMSLTAGLARQRENVDRQQPTRRTGDGLLQVLLVVSRPGAEEDVEYQAVAAKLLDRLQDRAEVTLVRPGTFTAFERLIDRKPWDLVHYDGHGIAGKLAFEDGAVEAERIGRVLARAGVPIFALNACQSAVEATRAREEREVSSVARALVDTGAAAVIAMGASVRVSSAVTFFDRFYDELARGQTLSAACQQARRAIEAGRGHGPLDWAIPVLYLREDSAPYQGRTAAAEGSLDDLLFGGAEEEHASAPKGVFVGRDGDLYVLDRAVDQHPRVLLFGVGGIGKTTLMEYLLEWRARTGGADRAVRFSFRGAPSLEQLAQELQKEVEVARPDAIARFRTPQWAHTPVEDRLRGLARVLAVDTTRMRLFLFDNLETLGGYPEVSSGPYTAEDRAHFRALLAALEGPSTRVVMTSRRDEVELLDASVRRFPLSGVRGRDRLPMLQAYAEAFAADSRLRETLVDDAQTPLLGELLQALAGHPLATKVAAYGLRERPVAQVLKSIRGQAEQIEIPAAEEGARSVSLEATFAGVLEVLPEERRRALGILGLFAELFHESDLIGMVAHENFPEGILADRSEGALRRVLAEAYRLGLIAPARGLTGVWEIVPGAQAMLDRLWREALEPEITAAVERHFVRYWAATAWMYKRALHSEDRAQWGVVYGRIDEGNLRQALGLAERDQEWAAARRILQLLLELWPMQGRIKDTDHLRKQWLRKISDAQGAPADPDEEDLVALWYFLMGDEANRFIRAGQLEDAEAIYQRMVGALEAHPQGNEALLAAAYHQLGIVEQLRGELDAAEQWYRRSLEIEEALGNRPGMAQSYHQLGIVEQSRGELDAAEQWYRRSLEIKEALGNRPGMARS